MGRAQNVHPPVLSVPSDQVLSLFSASGGITDAGYIGELWVSGLVFIVQSCRKNIKVCLGFITSFYKERWYTGNCQ